MKSLVLIGLLAASLPASAQDLLNMRGVDRPDPLKNIGIDQKLDAQLPLDTPFRDDNGRDVKLGDYFGKRPVVLALVYYSCPMLCTQILNGMVSSLRVITLNPGEDFDVVAVSFDTREGPALALDKKQAMLKQYGHPETAKGWHFLTGSPASVKALTSAVGFKYAWDAHTNQFAHASAIMVVTPEGKMSKYYYGIEYSPKDLRLGLIEAANNKIGTPVDQILLFCYHWDPATGKYTPAALGVMRLAAVSTLLMIGGFLFVNFRREARERAAQQK